MSKKNKISFSKDFKKQYHARRSQRGAIKKVLKDIDETMQCVSKNELNFRRIKIYAKLPKANEHLNVLVMSEDKIIIKRIE